MWVDDLENIMLNERLHHVCSHAGEVSSEGDRGCQGLGDRVGSTCLTGVAFPSGG